jgi:hypothetical protein
MPRTVLLELTPDLNRIFLPTENAHYRMQSDHHIELQNYHHHSWRFIPV